MSLEDEAKIEAEIMGYDDPIFKGYRMTVDPTIASKPSNTTPDPTTDPTTDSTNG